jgi:hypothetical protein
MFMPALGESAVLIFLEKLHLSHKPNFGSYAPFLTLASNSQLNATSGLWFEHQ